MLFSGAVRLLVYFAIVALLLFFPLALFDVSGEEFLLLALTLPTGFIVLYPVIFGSRVINLYHPLLYVFVTAILGVTIRTFFIIYSGDEEVWRFFFADYPISSYILGAIVINVGLVFVACGSMLKVPLINMYRFRIFRRSYWSKRKLILVSGVCLALSGYGLYIYFKTLGLSVLALQFSSFSKKRYLEVEGSDFDSSMGYIRWLGSLSKPIFFISLTYLASRKAKLFSMVGSIVIVSFLLSILFPFLLSARIQVIYLILSGGMIWSCRRKVGIGGASIVIFFCLALFAALSSFRAQEVDDISDIGGRVNIFGVFESLVDNRNLLGISKTGQIVHTTNDGSLELKYGETFLYFFYGPIPRSLWPQKPPVLTGRIIRNLVYKRYTGGGIPPGIIAELYWNFHIVGVILGCFFIGLFYSYLFRSFGRIIFENNNAVVIYFSILTGVTDLLFSGGFSYCIMRFLQDIIPVLLILTFIRK